MHRLRLVIGLSLAAAATLSITQRKETPLTSHQRGEVRRLQAHFDSVDTELTTRDVAALSREQRASRARLAAWLQDYRNGASFPLNDGLSRHPVPIFRDSRGVLCAMAYLIDRSGRSDIVADIAARRNTGSVYELAADPRVVDWLDSTGLSVDEAARIQPSYGPGPWPAPGSDVDPNRISARYALASLASSGTALATLGVNVVKPSRLSGFVGFVAGTVAMVHGLMRLDDEGGTRRVAVANTAAGAAAMGMSLRGIMSSPGPSVPVPVTAKLSNVQLAPTVGLLGSPQIGFVMRARF